MNKADQYYIKNLTEILTDGCYDKNPRPKYKDGTPAHSIFITQVFEKYDLSKNEFPITTLRNTAIKTGICEMFWIYQKQSNKLSDAHDLGIFYWDNWDIGTGDIGKRYGWTVREYDLMNKLLYGLEYDPFSRRHIINLYQETNLSETDGLYPCAYETLWSVREVNGELYLDMHLTQRSNDFLTAGFINKIQYVALQMMIAGHLNYKVGKFSHYVQNLHIYDRHIESAHEILERTPLSENFPYIKLKENKYFYDYKLEDFEIYNIDKIQKIKNPLELGI